MTKLTEDEQRIVDFLERRVKDADLYFAVYDYHEAMHDAEVLPPFIEEIKSGKHREEYQPIWEVEPEDLKEYEEDVQ